ncbi:hypothetical protein CYMTET_49317 [Cymbomonas tetramitiformis]|uniref:Uncharacterized protein n=1 Tax=Cymbomonas tetramitiformis TaxID=36881 RepID=A0AAE0BS42_9CHLO|nr:hypothetical protein CYMTET_49317 [Cymbomonas tetramitiformis]
MEWRKQQLQERAIEQAQAANEIATLKKERSIALDMIKERDEELAVYKGRLEKLTTESQDQLSVASEKLKKQKTAASQLAELLGKTQKERDDFRLERDELNRPDSMPCSDALKAKDAAIAALVEERHVSDQSYKNLKKELKTKDEKLDKVLGEVNGKEVELDKLQSWKNAATVELENLQSGARSSSIWAAAIDKIAENQCPEPIPSLTSLNDLGDYLQSKKAKVAVEIGCGESMGTANLLSTWTGATQVYCITPPHQENSTFNASSLAPFASKVNFLHNFTQEMVRQFPDGSLDLLHIASGFDDAIYDQGTISNVLELFWPKLKLEALLVGGLRSQVMSPEVRKRKLTAMHEVEEFTEHQKRQLVFQYQSNL